MPNESMRSRSCTTQNDVRLTSPAVVKQAAKTPNVYLYIRNIMNILVTLKVYSEIRGDILIVYMVHYLARTSRKLNIASCVNQFSAN